MNRANGFTLLEMMMAIALSALLMIGVMAVIADLGTGAMRQTGEGTDAGAVTGRDIRNGGMRDVGESVARLMGEDLRQAEDVDARRVNRVVMKGYCGLDEKVRDRMHRPVLVEYAIEQMNGKTWLVRKQVLGDVLTNQNVQRDLVCSGLTGFVMSGVGGVSEGSLGSEKNEKGGVKQWAGVVRLELRWEDQQGQGERYVIAAGGGR